MTLLILFSEYLNYLLINLILFLNFNRKRYSAFPPFRKCLFGSITKEADSLNDYTKVNFFALASGWGVHMHHLQTRNPVSAKF